MNYTNSVTSKGRVTIPKALRDAIGLETGQLARFELLDERTIAIKSPLSGSGVRKLVGRPSHAQPLTTKEKTRNFDRSAGASKTRMFKSKDISTARDVAKFGWHQMQEGKIIAIHGTNSRIQYVLSKILPRKFLAKMIKKIQS